MSEVVCKKCGEKMVGIDSWRRLLDPDEVDFESLTEGQQADYMAAEMSGEWGDWAVDEVLYECPRCKDRIVVTYI